MRSSQVSSQASAKRRALDSARLVLGGVVLNVILTALKFAGGIFGHAYALIADGTESLVDILSSLLVWGGFRIAARPPDENHPYGHGKAEPLAALGVALSIFMAAAWIGWHSVHGIMTPHRGPHWLTLPLLVGIVAAKVYYARRVAKFEHGKDSAALRAEAWHHGADALTSAAAFVGIAIAVIGGAGYESADDWAALFASVVITYNGVEIFRKALDEVMDTAVDPRFEGEVRAAAGAVAGVRAIEKCRVRKSGLNHLVEIHVKVDGGVSVRQGHDIAHAVKDTLLVSPLAIGDVVVHVEPADETPR